MRQSLYTLFAAALLATPNLAAAQEYPSRPIVMLIPFTPGGSSDTLGRFLAAKLSEKWGQPIAVENRPGAGSLIGMGRLATSDPDGYTIAFSSNSFTASAAVTKDMAFSVIDDLQPVAQTGTGEMVVVTGAHTGMTSLDDLIAKSKEGAVFFGSTGIGAPGHFIAELINAQAGIQMQPVSYSGGSEALMDMGGGRLDVYVGSVTSVLSAIENKWAIPVAIASKQRSPLLPEVATTAESGVSGVEYEAWWGVFTPTGTPDDIVAKLHDDATEIMTSPEAAEFMRSFGAAPTNKTTEQFAEDVAAEVNMLTAVAKGFAN